MTTKLLHDKESNAVLMKAFCNGSKLTQFDFLESNVTGAAPAKHLPVATIDGNIITVDVGEIEHPMDPDHFIAFILLETKKGDQVVRLAPGMKPQAVFAIAPDDEAVAVYEFCNKHGLWKTPIVASR